MNLQYKTFNEYKDEAHPWEPFVPPDADKIILGTFPTVEKNRNAFDFFYPNPNNDFWNIIFKVAGKKLEDHVLDEPVECRRKILTELKLGIADMGKKILRQKDSSKDDNLFPIEYTNIFELLDKYPSINKIIVTSSSGGNSVLSWFHHYCVLNKFSLKIPKKSKLPFKTELQFHEKPIEIAVISSPSRLSRIKGDPLFQMYKNAISN